MLNVNKEMLKKVIGERTVLVVKMEGRLEPAVVSGQVLTKEDPDMFENVKFSIESMGFEVEELVLEATQITRLRELLDDYYMKKIDAVNAFASIMKDFIREDDAEYLMNVDPLSAGAFLLRDEEGIFIETDINLVVEGMEEMTEEELSNLSTKELLEILERVDDGAEEEYYDDYCDDCYDDEYCDCDDCDCDCDDCDCGDCY